MKSLAFAAVLAVSLAFAPAPAAADWVPVKAPLDTPWTARVDPAHPLPEHPRPDFHREAWLSLNGLWDYALEPVDFKPMQGFIKVASMTTGPLPAKYSGRILVPFAIDAPLSGIMHVLRPQERLWYHREFELPTAWQGQRVLLHFEASDWETSLYVNGQRVGQHRGGYDPFEFDITEQLRAGANTLHVCVWDGTEQHCQPVGKQIMPENRQGFRYQPTGGIWQTVWLEAVPATALAGISITPSLTGATLTPTLHGSTAGITLRTTARDGGKVVATAETPATGPQTLAIPQPKLWSPDSPHLYDLTLELVRAGRVIDTVTSYVGLRTIARDATGRFLLNGRPAPFMLGPLDQGYWPDGILTPPHEDAITFDLSYLKSIGCNLVRVHIKTHPTRWYYHADRLGLLVWQDMICTPKYGQTVDAAGSDNWRHEFQEIITDFHNHPSIIQWIVFNEAWGQHDTTKNTAWAAAADPSRLILGASGWTDVGSGDVLDVHNYTFYPSAPTTDGFGRNRARVFGELGGHNLLLPGQQWHPDQQQAVGPSLERAGGRMNFNSTADLAAKYPFYFRNLHHFVARQGYQAFVYTQISDIEHECNGWLTYDRRISKLPAGEFRRIHETLSQPRTYALLAGGNPWQARRVPAAARGAEFTPLPWTAPTAAPGPDTPLTLPHAGGPIAAAQKATPALGLRQEFTLTATPARAVLELRATHRDAHGEPPAPKLDGHRPQARTDVPFVAYLDGKLFRRGACGGQRGQGEGVMYLELTDPELATLTPGRHTLAIELSAPETTIGFDAKLWSYLGF